MKSQMNAFIEDLGNGIDLEMIYIAGDTFMMGSPKGEGDKCEKPQHKVTIQPFFMSKYPITQTQYQQITRQNPSDFKDNNQRPIEDVSWNNAVEFCGILSKRTGKKYRLPSEAEWEYACRAGTTTKYHFGDTITDKLANYDENETTPVGKYPPNAFGLYDMHGNVWEWCEDNWHENYEGAPTDESAWLSGDNTIKVVRGGSWDDFPDECRSAYRYCDSRDEYSDDIGVRVVCVAPKTT